MRRWTESLWDDIEPAFGALVRHPLVTGLVTGALERDAFELYVRQDVHYLAAFARALAACAARADDTRAVELLCSEATQAVALEKEVCDDILGDAGAAGAAAAEPGPTTLAYSSYVLAVAHARPFHEGLAAVLPCYWLFRDAGRAVAARESPDPLYRRWLATYTDPQFVDATGALLALADRTGARVDDDARAAAARHARVAARYELMMCDAALARETWPQR